jgi:DNA topoisomerase-1
VKLGNRPATCRKYYIHPAILDAYSDGSLFDALKACEGERREEACVIQVVSKYAGAGAPKLLRDASSL